MSYRSEAQILNHVCASTNSLQCNSNWHVALYGGWKTPHTHTHTHTHTQKHTDLWAGTILTSKSTLCTLLCVVLCVVVVCVCLCVCVCVCVCMCVRVRVLCVCVCVVCLCVCGGTAVGSKHVNKNILISHIFFWDWRPPRRQQSLLLIQRQTNLCFTDLKS